MRVAILSFLVLSSCSDSIRCGCPFSYPKDNGRGIISCIDLRPVTHEGNKPCLSIWRLDENCKTIGRFSRDFCYDEELEWR